MMSDLFRVPILPTLALRKLISSSSLSIAFSFNQCFRSVLVSIRIRIQLFKSTKNTDMIFENINLVILPIFLRQLFWIRIQEFQLTSDPYQGCQTNTDPHGSRSRSGSKTVFDAGKFCNFMAVGKDKKLFKGHKMTEIKLLSDFLMIN